MAKNWADNFSELFRDTLPSEGNKEWRFALEEHKTKGTMQMNVRKFQVAKNEGDYEGPTKNGFIEQIKTIEDVDALEKAFSEYFKKVRSML